MNEKFFDLSREKQDRMINGALEVFAKNGYKHASTDDMVKAVDVSKGLWFHYFGSKAGLYTFVYGYSVKYMILELSSAMDAQEKDYFEVVRQMEYTKMRVSKSYPYMNLFLQESARETDEDILEQTQADRKILDIMMQTMSEDNDMPTVVYLASYLYSIIGTWITSTGVNYMLSGKVKTICMVDALKGVE